ncbi:MAG: response regulator [bacterium]
MEKLLISVIDDDEFIQRLLRDTLELAGYRTTISGSAEECYRKLATEVPDLFVIDIILPGQDGIQLCKNLRKQPLTQHRPIIILSSKAKVQDRIIGLEAGADDYLVKPFHLDELLARIKANLRQAAQGSAVVDKSTPETKKPASRNSDAASSQSSGRGSPKLNEIQKSFGENPKNRQTVKPALYADNSVTEIESIEPNADFDTKKRYATELYQRRLYEKAYRLFEILAEENPKDQYVKKYLEVTKTSLMKFYLQLLGSKDAIPVRISDHPEDFIGLDLNSQEGFIFSRIDGITDFKGIVAISAMKPLTAYGVLFHLMQSGVIKIKK